MDLIAFRVNVKLDRFVARTGDLQVSALDAQFSPMCAFTPLRLRRIQAKGKWYSDILNMSLDGPKILATFPDFLSQGPISYLSCGHWLDRMAIKAMV